MHEKEQSHLFQTRFLVHSSLFSLCFILFFMLWNSGEKTERMCEYCGGEERDEKKTTVDTFTFMVSKNKILLNFDSCCVFILEHWLDFCCCFSYTNGILFWFLFHNFYQHKKRGEEIYALSLGMYVNSSPYSSSYKHWTTTTAKPIQWQPFSPLDKLWSFYSSLNLFSEKEFQFSLAVLLLFVMDDIRMGIGVESRSLINCNNVAF